MKESDQVPLIDEKLGWIGGTPGWTVVISVPVIIGTVSPARALPVEEIVEDWASVKRLVAPEIDDRPSLVRPRRSFPRL